MFTCPGKHPCFSSWLVTFKASAVTAPSPRVPSTFDRPETGARVEANRRSECSGSRRRNPFFRVKPGKSCEGEGEAVALRGSHMAAVRAGWGRRRCGGAGGSLGLSREERVWLWAGRVPSIENFWVIL